MNKNKIGALAITGVLALGVVGGSFAWFTAEETATNKFATAGSSSEENGAGIEIWENFDKKAAASITPGGTIDKKVQFKSNVDYDQFVRVKITPQWTELLGIVKDPAILAGEELKLSYVNLAEISVVNDGQWVKGNDGYFYYIGVLPAGEYTNQLLDTVQLDGKFAGNEYKNAKFDVVVNVESVQASNSAILSVWGDNEITQRVNKSKVVNGVQIEGSIEVTGDQFYIEE